MNATFRTLLLASAMAFALNIAHAGINANGINANGINANGINANGINANGVNANGINANGISANGLYANGGAKKGVAPHDPSLLTERNAQIAPSGGLPKVESISLPDGRGARVR